jgi:hypothetical protein
MGVMMLTAGILIVQEYYFTSFLVLMTFVVSFQLSQGCIAWLYCSEVPVDKASGVVMSGQFIMMLILSFAMEFLINGPLQIHGTFWLFSGACFLGAVFVQKFIRESKGLTDKEKKRLYSD